MMYPSGATIKPDPLPAGASGLRELLRGPVAWATSIFTTVGMLHLLAVAGARGQGADATAFRHLAMPADGPESLQMSGGGQVDLRGVLFGAAGRLPVPG